MATCITNRPKMRKLLAFVACIAVDATSVCPPSLKPLCDLIGGVGDIECVLSKCSSEMKACLDSPTCSSGQFSFMQCNLSCSAASALLVDTVPISMLRRRTLTVREESVAVHVCAPLLGAWERLACVEHDAPLQTVLHC